MLVVDNDAPIREGLRFLLEGKHTVVTASDGEEALALFTAAADRGQPFEVVLIDNKMPGMDGIELTRRVKEMRPITMVGMISGNPDIRTAALRAGANGFLMKPADVEAIRAMVKGFVQVARAVARQTA